MALLAPSSTRGSCASSSSQHQLEAGFIEMLELVVEEFAELADAGVMHSCEGPLLGLDTQFVVSADDTLGLAAAPSGSPVRS